jgi:lipopolysaccharide transport system permease protein
MRVPLSYFIAPWAGRTILRQFVRREIFGRYRGSVLGVGWAFLTPLMMLAVYTFVFVGVFKARWPGAESAGGVAFALRLFAGLIVFNLFSEVVGRAPLLMLDQPNLIKKVVFPLELLSFVSLGSALVHFLLGVGILLVGTAVLDNGLSLRVFLLPVVLLPLLPMLLGLSWLLSALGIYVRDIGPVVGLGVSFLLFLSPVFYSLHSLSERLQFWMSLNPLTPVIESLRSVVFLNAPPDWTSWGLAMVFGLLMAALGAWSFAFLRSGFADVV